MNAPTRDLKAKVWARDGLDWYVEGEAASAALFKVERFIGAILDPCCGGGNIVKSALSAGYAGSKGTDIVDRTGGAEWFSGAVDFMDVGAIFCPNIVMNPPFFSGKGAEAFIRRALLLANGKVAAFVDTRFLNGAKRANGLYSEHPPARVWMVTPRISCPPGAVLAAGGKAQGGTADWCWIVWDRTAPASSPQIGWLRGVGK